MNEGAKSEWNAEEDQFSAMSMEQSENGIRGERIRSDASHLVLLLAQAAAEKIGCDERFTSGRWRKCSFSALFWSVSAPTSKTSLLQKLYVNVGKTIVPCGPTVSKKVFSNEVSSNVRFRSTAIRIGWRRNERNTGYLCRAPLPAAPIRSPPGSTRRVRSDTGPPPRDTATRAAWTLMFGSLTRVRLISAHRRSQACQLSTSSRADGDGDWWIRKEPFDPSDAFHSMRHSPYLIDDA